MKKNNTISLPESPIQRIHHPLLSDNRIELLVKRDDLLHPIISGNKWRKLKYNLRHYATNNYDKVISFGGAFSNHIHALAAAGRIFNLNTHGIIRGPQLDLNNPTLKFAKACGMELEAITRLAYREKNTEQFINLIKERHPNCFIVPEGGTNQLAIKGVTELALSLPETDHIFTATGSAGTLAGLIEGSYNKQLQCHGIAVLKNADYLKQTVAALSPHAKTSKWQLHTDYHRGGYGKFDPALLEFCRELNAQLPLEPIYTGKMMMALFDLIKNGYFKPGERIIAIHTGGLQGLAGIRYMRKNRSQS